MTASRLNDISNEISEIDKKLSFLDPSNTFESHTREILLYRLSKLKRELKISILETRKQKNWLTPSLNSSVF